MAHPARRAWRPRPAGAGARGERMGAVARTTAAGAARTRAGRVQPTALGSRHAERQRWRPASRRGRRRSEHPARALPARRGGRRLEQSRRVPAAGAWREQPGVTTAGARRRAAAGLRRVSQRAVRFTQQTEGHEILVRSLGRDVDPKPPCLPST